MEQNNIIKNEAETGRNWLPVCLVSFGAFVAIFTAVFAIIYAGFDETFAQVLHKPFLGGAGWISIVCAVLAFGIAFAGYMLSDVKMLAVAGGIAIIVLSIVIMVMGAFMRWGALLVLAGLLCLVGGLYLLGIKKFILQIIHKE